jgi:hypothetical protein
VTGATGMRMPVTITTPIHVPMRVSAKPNPRLRRVPRSHTLRARAAATRVLCGDAQMGHQRNQREMAAWARILISDDDDVLVQAKPPWLVWRGGDAKDFAPSATDPCALGRRAPSVLSPRPRNPARIRGMGLAEDGNVALPGRLA